MHTPGPWTVNENRDVVRLIFGPYQGRLADVHWYSEKKYGPAQDECFANARLIAAAPEMLEALKEAVEFGRQELKDVGGCDHAVGICSCGIVSMITGWEEIIRKAEATK